MNIFAIYSNPVKAAHHLCDQHLNKMVVESAQMLATCFTLDRLAQSDCPRSKSGKPRRHSYYNHPCTKWTRASLQNMIWLIIHTEAMETERLRRGFKPHFTMEFISWCAKNYKDSIVPDGPLTEFAVAISDNQLCRQVVGFDSLSPVEKYQLYYKYDKPFATWKRNKPAFMAA